ncbi:hypothetical protein HID58_008267 [Brassica napus]|uniref:F-box associated beta-propeller type 1 domain-containing protein n=1 Tax=Brassica napus TaxID=3708 RepID=A0ABQ8DRL0_BRANA|nr:hypothetical protein HID58_008267 [Brassica napus]
MQTYCALLNDKRFIYKHLELSRERLIRVHYHKSFQFINLETLSVSSHLQSPSDINSMIHCDGLLLCEFDFTNKVRKRLAVWNPFLSQVKWIKPSSSYTGLDIYGFGYDNTSRDNYKILRFCNEIGYEEVEIYEFKSQLWRNVDYSCAYCWHSSLDQAMSMNGNMFWIAQRQKKSKTENFIQSFDFSREVFKETCCVPLQTRDLFLSGFGGDRLSFLSQHEQGKMIQVWVTNKVTDDVVSWSKYFNMTPQYLSILFGCGYFSFPAHLIHKTNRIMLWWEEEDAKNKDIYVNVYEIGEGVVEKQVETGRHGRCDQAPFRSRCCVFVPSLVPVPE